MRNQIIGALFLTLPAFLNANPVLNGDFEKEDSGRLAWWDAGRFLPSRVPNTPAGSQNLYMRVAWDQESHGQGSGSLRFDCTGTQMGKRDSADIMLASPINQTLVAGGVECTLTWQWKATGLTNASNVQIAVFCQSPGPTAPPPNGSKFLKQFTTTLNSDSPAWKLGELRFTTPPECGWIQIRISARSDEPGKKFSAWLDDFVLATEPDGAAKTEFVPPATWVARKAVSEPGDAGLPGFKFVAPAQPYGSRIQRTMRLLATSTPERRNRVKILCYGQSIIGQNWWKRIVADLRAKYPHADIDVENPSIGGFMSKHLKDTMFSDCYTANADLILFHDYGTKPEEMEEMFVNMRRLTTAEVMAFTHHLAGMKAWEGGQTKDSDQIAKLSAELGFELVDIRPNWRAYLEKAGGKEGDLLKDIIHLGPAGEALWWQITMPHFTLTEAKPYWHEWVKVYSADGKSFVAEAAREYPDRGQLLDKPLKLEFTGTRVDLLADHAQSGKLGTAKILIDGKAPSAFPELYYATRGTPPSNFFQPILRRAELGKDPVLEQWTLTFSGISDTGEDFVYEATGSVTGPDGKGNGKEKFVSNSGRLVIDPQQFMMPVLVKNISKGKPYPDGTTCKFEVRGNFLDEWKPQSFRDTDKPRTPSGYGPAMLAPLIAASENRYTVASGLSNGPHTLEIIPNGDGDLPLRAIVVHQPPKTAEVKAPAAAAR